MASKLPLSLPPLFLLLSLSLAPATVSAFTLARVLGDDMVLQAGAQGAVVWGFDAQGSYITLNFNGQNYSTTTDANLVFRFRLPPMRASTTPYDLTFTLVQGGVPKSTLTLHRVLFGEVVICGGQSNAQMSMSAVLNATQEIAAANYPYIRMFTVGQGTQSNTPLLDLRTIEQPWTIVSPATVSNRDDFGFFSAYCYFYARDLQAVLGPTVPIGAISNNWGGTCLQSWAPADVSSQCGVTATPKLFNAMIVPYTVGPMAVQSFLWSQGECNADSNTTDYYACAFPRFITSWRTAFQNPDAFFGFELLPAYIRDASFSPASLPYERAAQLQGLNAGGRTAVCNGMDLGDPQAPHGSVHPRNKQVVGARLAAASLALSYGFSSTLYLNPQYKSASAITIPSSSSSFSTAAVAATASVVVTVSFDEASLSGGTLEIHPAVCPTSLGVPLSECAWNEIQTSDGVWHNATTTLTPDAKGLVLSVAVSDASLTANATRGTFSPWPVVHVYSSAGFPALPWFEKVM